MNVAKRWLIIFLIALGIFFFMTTVGHPIVSATEIVAIAPVTEVPLPEAGGEEYPQASGFGDFLKVFGASGPAGVLSYGGYLIAKQWREGRAINLDAAVKRVDEAELRQLKAENRAHEVENELSAARERARKAYDIAEDDKARYHESLMELQAIFRERYNGLYDLLAVEISESNKFKGLLAEHNIPYDHGPPPPITKEMVDSLSEEDIARADEVIKLSTPTGPQDLIDPIKE